MTTTSIYYSMAQLKIPVLIMIGVALIILGLAYFLSKINTKELK